MKVSKAITVLTMLTTVLSLTGCSSLKKEMTEAMNNQQIIELSVTENSYSTTRAEFNWVELDQLTTHKSIRKVWDDKLNILIFGDNSKNGSIFIDTEGNWSGNNTLYNAFQNKVFVTEYWKDTQVKSALAQAAIDEYSNISGENTGIIASINAYFNLVPDNSDGTSGVFNYLTRAEVMSTIYRADTPVIFEEEDESFKSAVGENSDNIYAQNMTDYSYLDYKNNSLNYNSYNATMTRAEAIYMIVQRYFKEDYDNVTVKESSFTDCKNAGDIGVKNNFENGYAYQLYELEYCLQNSSKGVTEELYKALVVAKNKGIISSDTRWNSGINGGELLTMLITTYQVVNGDNYLVNAKTGANAGNSLYKVEVEEQPVQKEETTIEIVQAQQIRDLSKIDDIIKYYGDELDMTDEEIAEAKEVAE
jgi:hypothetical protein